jgi:hypothetical protein
MRDTVRCAECRSRVSRDLRWTCRATSGVFLILGTICPSHAQDETSVRRTIPAVRLGAPPLVDGDLSDSCWAQAARAVRFTDVLYGGAVADQTVVFLGYDASSIYVGFHVYDGQPQSIVARQTKRGVFPRGDDYVALTIDPFHTHKSADRSRFVVNPLGTQFAQLGGGRGTKLEWEGKWQAAARIGADGWTVEMAIPWSILNYPAVKGPVTCGINFDRFQQRTQIHSWWSNIGLQEFTELDGHWVGVQFPPFRPRLSLLPYASPGWEEQHGRSLRAGLDLRAALTPSLTFVGTLNPDFANVEEAVEGIDFSYGERFVPDRRPFFQEGAGIYHLEGETGQYFYSGRVGNFDTGANLYGKLTPQDTLGVLTALDLGHRADWILRGRHEFDPTSGIHLALINRDDERLTNRVLVLGGGSRQGFWNVSGSWAGSWWNGRASGSTATAHFVYESPRWYAEVTPHYIRPDFRDVLGFIDFTDFKGVNTYLTYSTEWRQGPLRRLSVDAATKDSDHYDGRLFRQERRLLMDLLSRSDVALHFGWDGGRFDQFDDTVFSVQVTPRASDPFHTFGVGYSWGRRAGAPYSFLTPGVTWRFGQKLTLGLASSILHHQGEQQQHILTFNHDFSPRQGIGGRLVAQTGGTNGYLSYRRSSYGGVETFLIVGDPNARRFRQRLVLKVVWPM